MKQPNNLVGLCEEICERFDRLCEHLSHLDIDKNLNEVQSRIEAGDKTTYAYHGKTYSLDDILNIIRKMKRIKEDEEELKTQNRKKLKESRELVEIVDFLERKKAIPE